VSIVEYIIPRYPAFQIRPLLAAIHDVFDALYRVHGEEFLTVIVRELEIAVAHVVIKANAAANIFTLLNWVNQVLDQLASADEFTLTKYLPDLIRWQATLLQLCLSEGKKKGLKNAAIGRTRACMSALFQQKDGNLGASAVQIYIKVLSSSKVPPFAAGTALGMVANVSYRVRAKVAAETVECQKSLFYSFFVKEVVGSKVRIPNYVMVDPHVCECLR
jgi:hypothetical protein